MLVKAVGEEYPVIAFHSGRTMVSTLLSWTARVRAGKVVWKQDEFPPGNYDAIEAYIRGEVEHVRKTWWGRSQGGE